jgi:hypothetical protein
MAMDVHQETARIFEFPLRPRRRLDNGRTVPVSGLELVASVVDQCWYHGEALHEDSKKPDQPKPC